MSPQGTEGTSGRKQRRISVGLTLHISGKERDGKPFSETASSANISRTGAQFTTIRDLVEGSEIEVLIPRRPGRAQEEDFVAQARIVRVAPGDAPEEKRVGIEFVNARFHRVFVSEVTSED
jgi:c-di-GMP-binding flagellar brake protein YcgR